MSREHTAGATERAIAASWSELLSVAEVGPDASFIELGGDSITATQCINRIHAVFGCEISFAAFLEPDMTLRRVAALVDEACAEANCQSPTPNAQSSTSRHGLDVGTWEPGPGRQKVAG